MRLLLIPILFLGMNSNGFTQIRCDIRENQSKTDIRPAIEKPIHKRSKYNFQLVFHVLYSKDEENIGYSQILSQVEVLNSTYDRDVSVDDLNIPSEFRALKTNPNIHFCLAEKDPDGEPTNGVTRTQVNNISNFCKTFFGKRRIMHTTLGGLDVWNPEQYINIYVVNYFDECHFLGKALYPWETTIEEDGIIIDYRALGFIGAASHNYPFHQGKTLVHEMGHYFGLKHLSDDTTNCAGDDLVNDTPPQSLEYFGCPSYPQSSCNQINMTMNYMGLVNDPCMHLFTKDQVKRMHLMIDQYKSNLSNYACSTTTDNTFNQLTWIYNEGAWQFRNPGNTLWSGELQLFDISGRVVWSGKVNQIISVSIPGPEMNLIPGIYILRIQHELQNKIYKLIKYS